MLIGWTSANLALVAITLAATVTQQEWRHEKKCGINAAYSLLRLQGVDVNYDDVSATIPFDDDGTDMRDVFSYIKRKNGSNALIQSTGAGAQGIPIPFIALIELEPVRRVSSKSEGHFVVVVDVKAAFVTYIDGTTGAKTKMPSEYFHKIWTGYAIADCPRTIAMHLASYSYWLVAISAVLISVPWLLNKCNWRFAGIFIAILSSSSTAAFSQNPAIEQAKLLRNYVPEKMQLKIQRVDTQPGRQHPFEQQVIFAFDGSKRYVEESMLENDGSKVVQKRIFDGTQYLNIRNERVGEIHSAATIVKERGSRFDCYYLRTAGIYIVDPTATKEFESLRIATFPVFLFERSEFSKADLLIDGLPSHEFVESGSDKLRSTTYLNRLIFIHQYPGSIAVRETSNQNHQVLYRVKGEDFRSFGDKGLMIPFSVRCQEISEQGNLTNESVLTVLEATPHVDDSLFKIYFPPGAMIANVPAAKLQYGSPDGELIDKTLNELRQDRAARNLSYTRYAYIGLAVVLCFAVTALVLRRYRRDK